MDTAKNPGEFAEAPAPYGENFESKDFGVGAVVQGQVSLDHVDPYQGVAALRFERAQADMDGRETSIELRRFPVCAGLWNLSVALRSKLYSPDSSYNGTVRFEAFDVAGRSCLRAELGITTGDSPWRVFKKQVELGSDAVEARFVIRLEKTYGVFHADDISAVYAGPVLKTVAAIKFATAAVGNLFLPDEPLHFDITVECFKPLPADQRVAVCVLRDYWGAEFSDPLPVPLTEVGRTDSGRQLYRGALDLAKQAVVLGKYYEIHATMVDPGLPEPVSEGSTFAVLPLAETKQYAPFDIPFTASGWNPGVPGFFPLCDRLGIRVADVYSRWSSTPPYEVDAPGIEIVKQLGMGALMSTMAHVVEGHRKGYEAYDAQAMHGGAKRLVDTYKDQLPIAIRNGNEPHPADDAQALEMIATYRAIYEGVKASDPTVIVTSTSCGAEEQFFRLGFQKYYDVYDFHQYADSGVIPADFARYEKLVEKYGGRKPVWSTEIGLNSQGMARSAVAIQMIKIFTRFFACGGCNASWFGVMWPDPDGSNVGTNGDSFDVYHSKYCLYSPKLTAITEYNMVNAICIKKVVALREYEGDAIATLFRDDHQRCLLVVWRDAGRQDVFLPLPGVGAVKAIRLDGSSSTLDAQGRGLTLTLSDEPVLLKFESATVSLPERFEEPRIVLTECPRSIVKGGQVRLVFQGEGLSPEFLAWEMPPRWRVRSEPTGFIVQAPTETEAKEGRVIVRLADGSGEFSLSIPVIGPVEVRLVPTPFKDGVSGLSLTIRNHGTVPQSVQWKLDVPEMFTMANGSFKLREPEAFWPVFQGAAEGALSVAAQGRETVVVPITNLDPLSLYTARLEMRNAGKTVGRERLFGGCLGVPHVTGGVVFDGRLGDPAWRRASPVTLSRESQYAVLTPRTARREGPEDLSGTMRMLWDERYLYLGMEVQDDVFCNPECDAAIWRGDGLQFLVDPCRESEAKPGKYDYCLGLGTKGVQVWCGSTADASKAPTEEVRDFIVKITPTGNRGDLVYELAIPWQRLSPFQPAVGANLGLAMIINDDDGHIRDSFIAWFGCAHSKQMSMNGDVILE